MEPYAASVAGRAVAESNKNPAPRRFRQFCTPQIFDVLKKRRENEHKFHLLERRVAGEHLSLSNAVGQASSFVTDTLPHLRTISPQGTFVLTCVYVLQSTLGSKLATDVNPHVDSLYSMIGQPALAKNHIRNETEQMLEDQAAVLEMDDIVEYDSDASDNQKNLSIDQSKDEMNSIDLKLSNSKSGPASISPSEPEIIVIDD